MLQFLSKVNGIGNGLGNEGMSFGVGNTWDGGAKHFMGDTSGRTVACAGRILRSNILRIIPIYKSNYHQT